MGGRFLLLFEPAHTGPPRPRTYIERLRKITITYVHYYTREEDEGGKKIKDAKHDCFLLETNKRHSGILLEVVIFLPLPLPSPLLHLLLPSLIFRSVTMCIEGQGGEGGTERRLPKYLVVVWFGRGLVWF